MQDKIYQSILAVSSYFSNVKLSYFQLLESMQDTFENKSLRTLIVVELLIQVTVLQQIENHFTRSFPRITHKLWNRVFTVRSS